MKSNRIAAIIVAGVLVAGCGTTEPEEGPPTLPPASAFQLDFSDFQSASPDVLGVSSQPGLNWGTAALTVGVWNTILAVTLVTPVAAFVAAVNQTPTWEGDHWEWSFDFNVLAVAHTARLEATPTTGGVNWSMFITGGNYTDFNWYNGFSALDGSMGDWSLQVSPQDPTPFMDIDWTFDAGTGVRTIRYTNAIPGHQDEGGYIDFSTDPMNGFDRFYQIYAPSTQATVDIHWDSVDKDGQIRAPHHYQDNNWRCWDNALDDIVCP